MIKKRYILIPLVGLIGLVIIIVIAGAIGYLLLSRHAGDTEMVFAATEVGTPVGDKVTKAIGPEGGSITSPDGRLTLTVPENALAETVAFSIQPVTNKFGGGLGLAYKLEPDGKTFDTPLDISVHYDDHDLEGTFPEALSLAYQDDKGAWHMQKAIYLDKDKKTIEVSTTHFSNWSYAPKLKVSPSEATVRVGEKVRLSLTDCDESLIQRFLIKILPFGFGAPCSLSASWFGSWKLVGEGTLTDAGSPSYDMIYTAPGKKPKPNKAIVVITREEFMVWVPRPCMYDDGAMKGKNNDIWKIPKKCGKLVPGPGSVEAVITIVDRGYKATGSSHDVVYSGDVCDVEKPFTVKGTGLANFDLKFVPSGPQSGTVSYTALYNVPGLAINEASTGTYKLVGDDADGFDILLELAGTAHTSKGDFSGDGGVKIHLSPATGNVCGGG